MSCDKNNGYRLRTNLILIIVITEHLKDPVTLFFNIFYLIAALVGYSDIILAKQLYK